MRPLAASTRARRDPGLRPHGGAGRFPLAPLAVVLTVVLGVLAISPAASAGPSEPEPGPLSYVALGDSYASGEGLGPFQDEACSRSVRSHPFLVQRPGATVPLATDTDPATTFASVACSGAKIADLRQAQEPVVTSSTGLVTLSVGGNDARFVPIIEQCFRSTCAPAVESVDALLGPLTLLYQDLQGTGATVVVTNYPQLFAGAPCGGIFIPFATFLTMSQTEWDNAAAYIHRLNEVIATAARVAGVHLVDIEAAFAGHDVCANEPWVNNVVSFLGIVSDESFHPNAEGQRQYARAINDALVERALIGPIHPVSGLPVNPGPDATATLPAPGTTAGALTVTPLVCGSPTETSPGEQVRVSGGGFRAGAPVATRLVVGSTTVATVNATAAANGTFSSVVTVPASLGAVTVSGNLVSTGQNPAFFTNAATAPLAINFFRLDCDRVAPDVTIISPVNNQVLIFGGRLRATYKCTDDRGVVLTCQGTVPNNGVLEAHPVGTRAFTVTSRDPSGNVRTRSVPFHVRYDASFSASEAPVINPFVPPVPSAPVVTLDVTLRNAFGTVLFTPASITSRFMTYGPCANPNTFMPTTTTLGTGPAGLRVTARVTSLGSDGCFKLTVGLDDGTTHGFIYRMQPPVGLP